MSFTVLMFGLMHALPPIIAAMLGVEKSTIYLVAIGTAIFAVISGSMSYLIFDLIGLAIGISVALKLKNPA